MRLMIVTMAGLLAFACEGFAQTAAAGAGFCMSREGGFYRNPAIPQMVFAFPYDSPKMSVRLDEARTDACDSEAAKRATEAYVVRMLRFNMSPEVKVEVDAFGPSYWSGNWATLRQKRLAELTAIARAKGAFQHRELKAATVVEGSATPMVLAVESSMYGGRSGSGPVQSLVYYTVAGAYAIEIRVTSANRFALAGPMDIVSGSIGCSSCSIPAGSAR